MEEKEEKGMTPDLRLLSGFARGVLLSLHVRDMCLHSGSWLLSLFFIVLLLCLPLSLLHMVSFDFSCKPPALSPKSVTPGHGTMNPNPDPQLKTFSLKSGL